MSVQAGSRSARGGNGSAVTHACGARLTDVLARAQRAVTNSENAFAIRKLSARR
jgi:hypothetical protein